MKVPWGQIWWYAFVLAFAATALAETFWPFRSLPTSTPRRWLSNSILLTVTALTLRFAYQLSGIALAFTIRAASHGALNRVGIPYALQFIVGFAAIDLTAYISHRLSHAIAPIWRLHQVHHSETDLDLTTGVRFHPVEGLFSQGLSLAVIALLGTPPAAVALAAIAIVVQDFFTHANLRLPGRLDQTLRLLVITPAMHRVHHSDARADQNANFGTIFSLWDRLFGTYLSGHVDGSAPARYGLPGLAPGSEANAAQLLALPFRRARKQTPADAYPVAQPVAQPVILMPAPKSSAHPQSQ